MSPGEKDVELTFAIVFQDVVEDRPLLASFPAELT
jgi:hypothetical protein